jgi:nucleotide-binding universal stress UspA family protein
MVTELGEPVRQQVVLDAGQGRNTFGVTHETTVAPRAELLDKTLSEALGDSPSISVKSSVVEGNPAKVLIDLSGSADLLVVGSRGVGGFTGLLLGSVSQHVAAHAQCTVTVVR